MNGCNKLLIRFHCCWQRSQVCSVPFPPGNGALCTWLGSEGSVWALEWLLFLPLPQHWHYHSHPTNDSKPCHCAAPQFSEMSSSCLNLLPGNGTWDLLPSPALRAVLNAHSTAAGTAAPRPCVVPSSAALWGWDKLWGRAAAVGWCPKCCDGRRAGITHSNWLFAVWE